MFGRKGASEFQITVAPVQGGWAVRCDGGVQPMLFLSGAHAERHARGLALRLSRAGRDAQVLVHDRSLALAGRAHYSAAPQYELMAG